MPRGNGMGPNGMGPGTGWGRGPCGRGRGFGRGGWISSKPYTAKDELEYLKQERSAIDSNIRELEAEIKRSK